MGGGGGGGEGEPEFQIAPMIDVLLTLLIFFMSITTAQVEAVDQSIHLPEAPDAKPRTPDPNQILVNVKWNKSEQKATYVLDGKGFDDSDELKTAIEAKRATKNNPELLIRGDRDLQAKDIIKAMNCAALAGIDNIAFLTVNIADPL
jgi:biopolymer transport protein ExbD